MFLGDRKQIIQTFILNEDPAVREKAARRAASQRRRAISTACSRPWTVCRSSCACSIRRCTSSSKARVRLMWKSPRSRQRARDVKTIAEKRKLMEQIDAMSEANPMLGLRGCRLGIVYPDSSRHAGPRDRDCGR